MGVTALAVGGHKGGGSFVPSSYGSPTTPTSTTAASEVIPAGATHMELGNWNTTPANYIIYAFGETPAAAEANLASGGSVLFATGDKADDPIAIPKAAQGGKGGFAYKSAAATPDMYKVYGVIR